MAHLPPPKPVPKPGQIKVVRALFKYTAQYPDELSFEEGDLLYILDRVNDPNWWKAKCGDRTGLIPSNYVGEHTESVDHPLHEAAKRGNLNFLKECLQNKVSVNGLDKSGSTALHWAAHGGHIECVMQLLQMPNCQLNVQNKLGDTPLHSAAWKGHVDVATALFEAGAKTDLINNDDKMPADLASDAVIITMLRSRGEYVDDDYDTEDSD